MLRHVDPERGIGRIGRANAAFSATRLGRFFSRSFAWRLDPWLLRTTRGRMRFAVGLPTAVLETRGARTGAVRRNAVIHFSDGDDHIVIASRAGDVRHPGWFHNLVANPDAVLGDVPMRATVVTDERERDRLWALADRVFPPYVRYRRDTAAFGRTIPIVRLSRR